MRSLSPKTRQHLEWDRVLARLADHCRGPVAADLAEGLEPCTGAALSDRLDRVSEARALLDAKHSLPLSSAPNLDRALAMAARGAVLEGEELALIGNLVEASARTRRYLEGLEEQAPALWSVAAGLAALPDLGRALQDSFDEHGGVVDSASGELGHLRTRVTGLHESLKQKVHGLLSKPELDGLLQDQYYTIREDRYVLPIRSGHKRHVDGIVHGWSATGATVYIEPTEVMEANNRLLMAQAEVEREVRRILSELSRRVGGHAPELRASQTALATLDLAWAGGLLSAELKANRPQLAEDGPLQLKQARHPLLLLQGVKVIPNDIVLEPQHRVLVLTGPNTGGKTVALKTVGLCALMAHSGLHIPAKPGSAMPLLPGLFTDIGDEQSLERSRSTFSGHIANLLSILEGLNPGSMVLLDELVVGTDPVQGAALAQAILEGLATRGSLVIATTHYQNLKALPFEDQRFRNGAVGYDADRRTPTYHLRMDVPGSSSALDTARRLGLPGAMVSRAEALAGPQQQALGAVIRKLEAELAAARAERKDAAAERLRLETARKAAETRAEKLQERLRKGIERERDAALQEARKVRETVRRLERGLKKPEQRSNPAFLQKERGRVERLIEDLVEARTDTARAAAGPAPAPAQLVVGQKVHVISLGNDAELLTLPDARGRCQVRAGILTATVKLADIRHGAPEPEAEPKPRYGGADAPRSWEDATPQNPRNTVDVRGRRAEEAVEAVGRFLDDLYARDEAVAFIIHGHGTGALKKQIRSWLKRSEYAREHRPGLREEGGDGVTAVLLR